MHEYIVFYLTMPQSQKNLSRYIVTSTNRICLDQVSFVSKVVITGLVRQFLADLHGWIYID